MSEENIKLSTEAEEKNGLDDETLRKLAAEYQAELDDLYERRKIRAAKFAAMTDEELEAALEAELEEVLADAKAHPVRTELISSDKD